MMTRAAVLASLLLVPALAHADTSAAPGAVPPAAPAVQPAPAAQPAPQNEDWSNVSHINGQIVKVGERNEYLYNYKKTNISGDPFGPFFGIYDLAVSHGITQNLAVSGSFMGWSFDHGDSTGYQLTVSMPIYLRRTFSGPFLEPGVIVRSTTSNYDTSYDCTDCGSSDNTDSWAGPELLFGWQWTFDSGLNVAYAAGVAKHMGTNDMSSSDGTDFNAYFRVGYAF